MSLLPEVKKQKITREVEIYEELTNIFIESIELLRERLRKKVESIASTTFLELTTEKTYKRLDINENYGLMIIDRDNRPVPIRSAGAEQIVALSLLTALNKTADKPAPVVIDTPFGRLDPKHRSNILHYVPNMANQVVFLVHEGEIEKDKGLAPISSHVGAIYEISRVSSSYSQLLRRKD